MILLRTLHGSTPAALPVWGYHSKLITTCTPPKVGSEYNTAPLQHYTGAAIGEVYWVSDNRTDPRQCKYIAKGFEHDKYNIYYLRYYVINNDDTVEISIVVCTCNFTAVRLGGCLQMSSKILKQMSTLHRIAGKSNRD